jgi:hypothetical protein
MCFLRLFRTNAPRVEVVDDHNDYDHHYDDYCVSAQSRVSLRGEPRLSRVEIDGVMAIAGGALLALRPRARRARRCCGSTELAFRWRGLATLLAPAPLLFGSFHLCLLSQFEDEVFLQQM